jgi:altronate dehydratase small subunit
MTVEAIRAIVLHPTDTVATALADIAVGNHVALTGAGKNVSVVARQPVPFGHKIALRTIEHGEDVLKYGEVIGRATKRIERGAHVHIHNIESLRGRGDLAE